MSLPTVLTLILVALIFALLYLIKQVRDLTRAADKWAGEPPPVVIVNTATDAAERAIDRHVQDFHRR